MSADQPQRAQGFAPLAEEDQTAMVQTEIGPLPEDLWEILGEPVPTEEVPSDTRPTLMEHRTEERNIDTEPETPPSPLSNLERPTRRPTGVVQRAEAPTTETSETPAETGEKPEDSLDIDELARRVYGEVRRRIDVEFERMRSHF